MMLRAVWNSRSSSQPGYSRREQARDPVVLAQEQHVEQHEADLGVGRVAARGEQRVEPLGRDLVGPDDLGSR